MKVVIALGGNALLKKGDLPSIKTQIKNAEDAVKHIIPIINKHKTVITHGNGPQVGNILIRSELAKKQAYQLTLAASVAQSEGELGYIIEQSILNKTNKPIVSTLTQVLVKSTDKAFKNPTKPIGPFMTKHQAKKKRYKLRLNRMSNWNYRLLTPDGLKEMLKLGKIYDNKAH